MRKLTFEEIQYIAGIFANLQDCLPTGYIGALNISSEGCVYIYVHEIGTWKTVLRHSWLSCDTIKTFEARLEELIQRTPALNGKAEVETSIQDAIEVDSIK